MTETSPNQLSEHFFRHNYAKMVAILVRYFGLKEVEIAEDIVQDTLVEAMEKWSKQPIAQNPEGWLMDVAKKRTINFLKRNQNFEHKVLPALQQNSLLEADESVVNDSTLRMIFVCCHPGLPTESQIALALKTLCGLSVDEIASALLSSKANINKRLYRAKQRFRKGSIPFDLPAEKQLAQRLNAVFSTLYLLFNEGYYSSHHEKVIRMDLCFEAIRLQKQVVKAYPQIPKGKALLSLMLLSVARFESRIDAKGALVLLSDQDRSLWDQNLIQEGIDYLHQSAKNQDLSAYHLQAGIAAEHCLATDFYTTNWKSIYQQYCLLEQLNGTALVSFNKAISRFYGEDPEQALADLLALKDDPLLKSHSHYFTSIGIFYIESGQKELAVPYLESALKLAKTNSEKRLIEQRLKL